MGRLLLTKEIVHSCLDLRLAILATHYRTLQVPDHLARVRGTFKVVPGLLGAVVLGLVVDLVCLVVVVVGLLFDLLKV